MKRKILLHPLAKRRFILCCVITILLFVVATADVLAQEPTGEPVRVGPTLLSADMEAEAKNVEIELGQSQVTADGAFSYAYSIEIPEGRQHVQPNLALTYNSRMGNGIAGVGWMLSGIPALARMDYGGIFYDSADTYAYLRYGWGTGPPQNDRLVSSDRRNYHTHIFDGARYDAALPGCGVGPCYWVRHDGKGNKWYFGGDDTNNAATRGHSWPYVIWEPDNGVTTGRGIQVWGLYKMENIHGNFYLVEYRDIPGELYPDSIRYTLHNSQHTEQREVHFYYDERNDVTLGPYRFHLRLTRIEVLSKGNRVHSYDLEYGGYSVGSSRSLLRKIHLRGQNGYRVTPPVSFKYAEPSSEQTQMWNPLETMNDDFAQIRIHTPGSVPDKQWETHTGDVNHDGFADLVRVFCGHTVDSNYQGPVRYQTTAWACVIQYVLGSVNGFGDVVTVREDYGNEPYPFGNWRSVAGDVNGDGFDDLALYQIRGDGNNSGIALELYRGGPEGLLPSGLNTRSPVSYRQNVDSTGEWVLLTGDINGDSRLDLVVVHPVWQKLFYALGKQNQIPTFEGPVNWPLPTNIYRPLVIGTNTVCSHLCMRFVGALLTDINGDGLDDFIIGYSSMNTSVYADAYSPNYGELRINYGLATQNGISDVAEQSEDTAFGFFPGQELSIGDFNGDERQDMAFLYQGYKGGAVAYSRDLRLFLARSERTASTRSSVFDSHRSYLDSRQLPHSWVYFTREEAYPDTHKARWQAHSGDVNGDGITDLVNLYQGYMGLDLDIFSGRSDGNLQKLEAWTIQEEFEDGVHPPFWQSALGDINGDGIQDLIMALYRRDTGTKVEVALGRAGYYLGVPIMHTDEPDIHAFDDALNHKDSSFTQLLLADINGDRNQDLILVENSVAYAAQLRPEDGKVRYALSTSLQPDLLLEVTNGYGGSISPEYLPWTMADRALYCTQLPCQGEPNPKGSIRDTRPRYLVNRVFTDNGRGLNRSTKYAYHDGRYMPELFGSVRWLGFEQITTTDEQTWSRNVMRYRQDPPFEVLPKEIVTEHFTEGGKTRQEAAFEWIQASVWPSIDLRLQRKAEKYLDKRHVLPSWELSGERSWEYTRFDYYGNVQGITECADSRCIFTFRSYTNNDREWLIGRLDSTRQENKNGLIIDWEHLHYKDRGSGFFDVVLRERILFDSAENAYCTNMELGSSDDLPCSDNIQGGVVARWVPVEYDHVYDDFGNLLEVRDALGRKRIYSYDHDWQTYIETRENALQQVEVMTYNDAGRLEMSRGVNLQDTTHYTYDTIGRPEKVIPNLPAMNRDGREQWSYENWGDPNQQHTVHRLSSSIAENMRITEWFDGFGTIYKTSESDHGQGEIITLREEGYEPDPSFGGYMTRRVIRYSKPFYCRSATDCDPIVWFEVLYDGADRPLSLKRVGPDGVVTLARYSYEKNCVMQTDAEGRKSTECFDTRGQLVSRTDAANNTTRYFYDDAQRIIDVVPPDPKAKLYFRYDSWGRKRWETDPHQGMTQYVYDDVGNLVSVIDALNQTVEYLPDVLNRVRFKITPTDRVEYIYDDPQVPHSIGRLTEVQTDDMTTKFTAYDPQGRVLAKEVEIPDLSDTFSYSYAYDWLGRLKWKVLPDYTKQVMLYKANAGPLDEVKVQGHTYAFFHRYAADGRLKEIEFGTGITTTYTYNDAGYLETLQTTNINGKVLQDYSYSYDLVGNVRVLFDLRGQSGTSANTNDTQHFTYDVLDRLKTARGRYGYRTYNYDAMGNIIQKGDVAQRYFECWPYQCIDGEDENGARIYLARHNIVGNRVSFSNYTAGESWYYVYDAEHRMVEAYSRGRIMMEASYDHGGRRFRKVYHRNPGDNVTTYYLDNDFEVRVESSGSLQDRSITRHILTPLSHIATETDGVLLSSQADTADVLSHQGGPLAGDTRGGPPHGMWFFHPNHQGSTSVVTDPNLEEVTRLLYEPYGEVLPRNSTGFVTVAHRFNGQEGDDETGLLYYGARYYDPVTARFTTADKIIPGGGRDLQGLNRFSYAFNNPLRFTDPTGQQPIPNDVRADWMDDPNVYLEEDQFLESHLPPIDNTSPEGRWGSFQTISNYANNNPVDVSSREEILIINPPSAKAFEDTKVVLNWISANYPELIEGSPKIIFDKLSPKTSGKTKFFSGDVVIDPEVFSRRQAILALVQTLTHELQHSQDLRRDGRASFIRNTFIDKFTGNKVHNAIRSDAMQIQQHFAGEMRCQCSDPQKIRQLSFLYERFRK